MLQARLWRAWSQDDGLRMLWSRVGRVLGAGLLRACTNRQGLRRSIIVAGFE